MLAHSGLRPTSFRSLRTAQERVSQWLTPTPVVPRQHGVGWLKLECLQQTGSYKVRGALNAIYDALQRRPAVTQVVCASAGNHAAGVAWAARALGLTAVAVVPEQAPQAKVDRCERLGARVIRYGAVFDDALHHAQQLAETSGAAFIHAFDHPAVIAGQSTVGAELLPLSPSRVVVPIGGGGLASGVCLAFAGTSTRVIGVQVAGVDAMAQQLRGRTPRAPMPSWADGIAVRRGGRLTQHILEQHLDELWVVDETAVRWAMRELLHTEGIVSEGAGALAYAATQDHWDRDTVYVVSGRNVDPSRLQLHSLPLHRPEPVCVFRQFMSHRAAAS